MSKTSETPRDLRKKLSRSTFSRNLLKDKQRETQYKLKKNNNCLSAMTISRDKWRVECKKNKARAQSLEKELSNVTQERDELMAKLKDADSLVIKKKEEINFSKRSPGYCYHSWLIYIAILLVTKACLSIRAVHKVFEIFSLVMPNITRIPSRSTIRLWVLKFGIHKLMEPKAIANDWAIIIDHTIQIGKLKILLVLGLRLSHLPFNRSLALADVQPLVLLPMQSSTGPKIQEVLINLKSKLGTIREVVADEGPDIKSGVNLYKKNNKECDYINDIVHKLAHFLQADLKNDKAWEELLKRASETRAKLLQTEYAYLIPPQRRDKARYLNLEEFIKWAYRILIALQSDQLSIKDQEAVFKAFAWVFGLADDVKHFHQLWQVTSA